MPSDLPYATEDQKQLAERDGANGYDTEVARFFGAHHGRASDAFPEEDSVPTDIDGGDLGRSARERAVERARPFSSPLK